MSENSNTSVSKSLVINPYSDNPVMMNQKAKDRAAAIEARRLGSVMVTKVDRVSSITVEVDAIVMGSHAYVSGSASTQYVTLLVIDPTSVYNGDEVIFLPPSEISINKEKKTLALPISTSKNIDESRAKWAEKGVIVPPCQSHYNLSDCFLIYAKVATPSPVELPIHSGFRVTISAFGYLLEPENEKRNAQSAPPTSVGITLRAHVMKQTTESNSPLLHKIFLDNPHLMKLPIPSFDEIKKTDITITKNDGKHTVIGTTMFWIPMLCGIEELEQRIGVLDKGTSSLLGFPNPPVLAYKKKDGVEVQVADVILSLIQWNGDKMYDDLVIFRLWTEALQLYGVTEKGPWGMGLGEAMMKQTPAIFNGKINHTDSEAYMRANTNESIGSILSLDAQQPIMDVPWAIMNVYGIPVTKQYAAHMSLVIRRQGPKAEPHPMFTIAQPTSFKENMYNTSSEPIMLVLNELDPNARPNVFKDEENDWQFFAVSNKLMMDTDKTLLKELRKLQNDNQYTGALGEMLLFKNWNYNDILKWKTTIYGVACNDDHTKVSSQHPVIHNKAGAMTTNEFFYIFAVSRVRYSAAISKKPVQKTNKRLLEITNEVSTSDNNNMDDDNNNNNQDSSKRSRLEE